MADEIETRQPKNYWKIAFWLTLLAFEFTREIAVIAADSPAKSNVAFYMSRMGDLATAQGRWRRTDGGSPLLDAALTIECRRDRGECLEASVISIDEGFFNPTIERFPAKFEDDVVTYENNVPECVRYSVKMDFAQKSVIASRELKSGRLEPRCAKLEPAIRMRLGDSYEDGDFRSPDQSHFVPIISVLMAFFRAIDGPKEAE